MAPREESRPAHQRGTIPIVSGAPDASLTSTAVTGPGQTKAAGAKTDVCLHRRRDG